MELHFLGTSSGVPTKTRNVTAIGLSESKGSKWYLIDCGEATQHQILRTKLSVNALEAIFITHIHGDHCYGLPGLLASAAMNGRNKPLTIIAPQGVKEWFEATVKFTQLHIPYEIMFFEPVVEDIHCFGQFAVSITALSHRMPSYAYVFTEQQLSLNLDAQKLEALGIPKGEIWGRLKRGENVEYQGEILYSQDFVQQLYPPRKIIVSGDNNNPDLLSADCVDCSVLVHEATYAEDMAKNALEYGHSYAKQVASFAQKNEVPNVVLTHFSPRYQTNTKATKSIEDLREEALSVYSGHLYLAEDFHSYLLDKTGKLSRLLSSE